MNHRQWFGTGVLASVVLALCCFTPILIILIGALGLSALAGWLDVVLIPALLASIALTFVAWRRWRNDKACAVDAGADAATKGAPH